MKFTLLMGLMLCSGLAQAAPHGMYPLNHSSSNRSASDMSIMTENLTPFDAGKLQYYGGPVISHAKVYAVFWGNKVDPTVSTHIGGFFSTVLNSTYLDWLTEYNTDVDGVNGRHGTNQTIGRGEFAGNVIIQPTHTANHLDDTDIQAELDEQITSGALPKNDDSTIYMTYFPKGISITIDGQSSCSTFCAYHEGFVSKTNGNVFYGVMPDLSGMCALGCGFHGKFNNTTIISSHEMTEAITDPFPAPGDQPAYPQAWNDVKGNEIGDLCAQTATPLTTAGANYLVQKEWDNAANACSTGPYQSP